eukprot:6329647-Lingulodinium_polyedra.AAC.1
MHSVVAMPHISHFVPSMRRPPRGGRRMECAHFEMCGAAATECVSDRVFAQFARDSCSNMRS